MSTYNVIVGSDRLYVKLENVTATTAPTVNDDYDDGYLVGSRWVDLTADRAYVCLDSTVGAAVWKEITLPTTLAVNWVSCDTIIYIPQTAPTPSEGMIYYDSDDNKLMVYTGAAWETITSA